MQLNRNYMTLELAKPYLCFSHLILTYFNLDFSAFHISALA
jgi:hypothetical protein